MRRLTQDRESGAKQHCLLHTQPGRALFIVVLIGILATSTLACPVWMSLVSGSGMPCSKTTPEKCPASICLLSSPYLASHVSAHVPPLQELSSAVVDSPSLLTSFLSFEPSREDDGAPPGPSRPLFLRTHSLLI
jgi:hypothetical protein